MAEIPGVWWFMSKVEQLLSQMVDANKQTAKSVEKLLAQVQEGLRKSGVGGGSHSAFNLGNIAATAAGVRIADTFGGNIKADGPGKSLSRDTIDWDNMTERQKARYLDQKDRTAARYDSRRTEIVGEYQNLKTILGDPGHESHPGTESGKEALRHRMSQLQQQMKDEKQKLWGAFDGPKKGAGLGSTIDGLVFNKYTAAALAGIATGFKTIAPGTGRVAGTWEHYQASLAEGMAGYGNLFNMSVRWGSMAVLRSGMALGVG